MRQEQTYARYALPGLLIVLVAGVLAVLVISGGSGAGKSDSGAKTPTVTAPKPTHRSIRVRAGDNPGTLADRAGIPIERLLALNPRLDPRALQVGDRLKLVP